MLRAVNKEVAKLKGQLALAAPARVRRLRWTARGPPLWGGCDVQIGEGVEGVEVEPDWDEAAQQSPDFEAGQRVSW